MEDGAPLYCSVGVEGAQEEMLTESFFKGDNVSTDQVPSHWMGPSSKEMSIDVRVRHMEKIERVSDSLDGPSINTSIKPCVRSIIEGGYKMNMDGSS